METKKLLIVAVLGIGIVGGMSVFMFGGIQKIGGVLAVASNTVSDLFSAGSTRPTAEISLAGNAGPQESVLRSAKAQLFADKKVSTKSAHSGVALSVATTAKGAGEKTAPKPPVDIVLNAETPVANTIPKIDPPVLPAPTIIPPPVSTSTSPVVPIPPVIPPAPIATSTPSIIPPPPVGVASSTLAHVVIRALQTTGGPGKTTNDFIELYNAGSVPFNLKGFRLVKRTKTGTTDTSLKSWTVDTFIPANGSFVWANSAYVDIGRSVDATTTGSIADDNGIALRQGAEDTGTIIDAVAWGSAQNIFIEGTVFGVNPIANQVLTRKDSGGVPQDTNINADDFYIP